MKNVKAYKYLSKSFGAANDLLAAIEGVEADDKEFYEQNQLERERLLAQEFLERMRLLMICYGQQIDGGSDDF